MRPEVNSNQFEISLRGKTSLLCKVTFTEVQVSVHMSLGKVKLTSEQTSLRSIWSI